MKVLAIETATPYGSIGLVEDERLAGEARIGIRPGGGERLPALIGDLLRMVQWKPSDLDLIVAGIGPGSYTGVRVGLALARSMAFALGKPLVGVPSQEAVAETAYFWPGVVGVLTDARRGEVYATLMRQKPRSIIVGPEVWELNKLIHHLNDLGESLFLLGDGIRVYRKDLAEGLVPPVTWGSPESEFPTGFLVARLGLQRWIERGNNEVETLEPLYLRRVEAEIRLEEKGRIPT